MKPREKRHPVEARIILTARGFGRHFSVKNISRRGAHLVGNKNLEVGERVTLNHQKGRINATVRWADQRNAGVQFEEPIDWKQIDESLLPFTRQPTSKPQNYTLN